MEIKEGRLAAVERAWPLLATGDTVKATATETARAPVKVKVKVKVMVMATVIIAATVAIRAPALLQRQPSKAAASTPARSRRSLPR